MVDGRELARGEFVVEGHDDGSLTLTITTSTYLWGIHSVVVTATDCCGNASEAEFALDVAPRASLDAVADGSGGVTFRWSHNLGPWTEATLSLTDIGGRVLTTWRLSAACRYEWPAHEVNSSAVVATLRLSSGGVRVVAEPLKLSR